MALMNAPGKLAQLLSLTREPFPASTKVVVQGGEAGANLPPAQVPMRGAGIEARQDSEVARGLHTAVQPS